MKNDFSEGKVWKNIISQAVPLTIAQFVQLLYNVVDRIYIGHMGQGQSTALTGVGITFPIITLIMAFTALFGAGGVPLFSIARGARQEDEAKKILGNSFFLLITSSVLVMGICYIFCKPILFLFGASEASYVYAEDYLRIYLIGTAFSMLTTGLNGYINAQGFPKVGMFTTIVGAVINIILDPVFIFVLKMGVGGAALATIISQCISAIWVIRFLTGKKAIVRLQAKYIRPNKHITKEIVKLGSSSFIMQGTTCLVQAVCNITLQSYGGDLYVGVMTVLNSVREVFMLPVMGITQGSLPVIGFNYGAKKNDRVKKGIKFNALIGTVYTMGAWVAIILFPGFWCGVFTSDQSIINAGVNAMGIYFFGFIFMSFQFAGQTVFQSVGDAKHAIFFSLLRKAIIVVPLTLLLPAIGFGINGVFLAEPISNAVGGILCFITMWQTVYKKL